MIITYKNIYKNLKKNSKDFSKNILSEKRTHAHARAPTSSHSSFIAFGL